MPEAPAVAGGTRRCVCVCVCARVGGWVGVGVLVISAPPPLFFFFFFLGAHLLKCSVAHPKLRHECTIIFFK